MAISKVENKTPENKSTARLLDKVPDKKIEIDPNEEVDDNEPIQASFESEEVTNNFASQPTKESETGSSEKIDPNTSAEDIQNQVNAYEASKSGKLEYKDLLQTATFIITLVDTSMSTMFKLIAKDTSASAYSMPAPNKKLLIEQLALVLAKYQSKFKIEFMLFMSFVVMYAPMAIESVRVRKAKTKSVPKKIVETKLTETKTEPVIETKKEEIKTVESAGVPFKRGKGSQRKAY